MAKYQLIKDLKTDRLGSDIVIANARLLKDAESGDMLIQVRLKKVSDEPVSAVNVKVICLDGDGKKIGEDITESFACNVQNGEYFGVKHPIRLEVKDASDAAVSIARVEYPGEENAEEAEENEEDSAQNDSGADEIEEAENAENDSAEEKIAENDSAEEAKQSAEPSESPQAESAPAEAKNTAAAEDDTVKKILLGFAGAAVLVLGIGAAVHFGTQKKPAVDAETLIAEVSETTVSSAAEGSAVTAAAKTETVTEAQTEASSNEEYVKKDYLYELTPVAYLISPDGARSWASSDGVPGAYDYYYNDSIFYSEGIVSYTYDCGDSVLDSKVNTVSSKLCAEYDYYTDDFIKTNLKKNLKLKKENSEGNACDTTEIALEGITENYASFRITQSQKEFSDSDNRGDSSNFFRSFDLTDSGYKEIFFDDLFYDSEDLRETIFEEMKKNSNVNIDDINAQRDYVLNGELKWYFERNMGIMIFCESYSQYGGYFSVGFDKIEPYMTYYGKTLIDPVKAIIYPHGNSIGNIMNYSAYTTDNSTAIYYAGGLDGYNWVLSYNSLGFPDGGTITDDYTDSVLYYDGWIYYRTYSDNNCLYRIKPDRTQKTKLSSSKVSRFNIDRGKLYFRENDVFCEANLDGSGKRVIINSPCYGSFVTDGCVYYLTSDSTGVICYNIDSGTSVTYNILNASYQIKFFTVEDGYIYLSAEGLYGDDAVAKYSIYYDYLEDGISFNGLKVYSFNMNNDYIYAAVNSNGTDQLLKISKSDFSNNTSYYGISITREFDIIGRTIYYFDEDGTAYQTELP